MTDLPPFLDYRISYCGPNGSGQYRAVWATPQNYHWQSSDARFDTPQEAEAYAGHALCQMLNK